MNSWNWSTSHIPSREAFYDSFYFDTELEYVPLPSLLAEAEGAEMEIAFLFQVMLARIIAFAMAAIGTWDYFWREAVGNVPPFKPCGERKTLPQVYQEALEETKSYMHNTAWETFRETCEEFREAGVFALDHPAICYLTW